MPILTIYSQNLPRLCQICRYGSYSSAKHGSVDSTARPSGSTGDHYPPRGRRANPKDAPLFSLHVRPDASRGREPLGPGPGGHHVEAADECLSSGTRTTSPSEEDRAGRSSEGSI